MTRKALIGVLAVVAAGAASGLIWFFVAGNVGDPTPVTAPPITSESPPTPETTVEAPVTTATPADDATGRDEEAEDSLAESATEAAEADDTDEGEGSQEEADQTVEEPVDSPDVVELEFSEGTEARFSIYEDLRGEPFTVVGATTEVVGRVRVDPSDLSLSEDGGDPHQRPYLRHRLLQPGSSHTGSDPGRGTVRVHRLPPGRDHRSVGAAEDGGEYTFSVAGELTVREITRPVTFAVVARWSADGRLEGLASATVLRSDFELAVPSVPSWPMWRTKSDWNWPSRRLGPG